jgi:hypothetical protein
MVVHTTNPSAWEKQFEKAEEDARENPYSEQIMYNEYSGESNTTPEVQVIDLMNDQLLGQDQQLRDQYKQDIRTQWGVTNVFDSELKDAGGLNNEGLQIEVTERAVATAMQDTETGPLDEMAKVLGLDDHRYAFVPAQEDDVDEVMQQVNLGKKATDAGLEPRFEDGQTEIPDGEFEADEGGGGLGALFAGDFSGEEPAVDFKGPLAQKAVGDDGWTAEMRTFRVVPGAGDDTDWDSPEDDPVLGVGVDFPNSTVYVDWNNAVFPDKLTHPHVSEYGSIDDLRKATGNDVVDYGPPPGARSPSPPAPTADSKAGGPVTFGNAGGDPFRDHDDYEAFCRALEEEGASVLAGDEPWEHASGYHDRPVVAYGIDLRDAESVWSDFEDDALSLGGPSLADEKARGRPSGGGRARPGRHRGGRGAGKSGRGAVRGPGRRRGGSEKRS